MPTGTPPEFRRFYEYKNVRLLISRLEKQLDSPEAARFNMLYFGNAWTPGMGGLDVAPVCKTQACLAGETVLSTGSGTLSSHGGIYINATGFGGWNILTQAIKDLKLTEPQSERLFFFSSMQESRRGWPKKFEEAYKNAKTPQGKLYVAIRRVEHFIET